MKPDMNSAPESTARTLDFDPAAFDDPLALTIDWTPAAPGGTNIGSHCLNQPAPNRIEFKPRPAALLFPIIFVLVGIALVAFGIVKGTSKDIMALVVLVPAGLVFGLAGFFLLRSWLRPRTFDLDAGYYWTGKTNPLQATCLDVTTACQIDDIHAIQIIDELCTSASRKGRRRHTYHSYELNLVLHDSTRINVVDHGRKYQLRADAEKLAEFLDVPLWDPARLSS